MKKAVVLLLTSLLFCTVFTVTAAAAETAPCTLPDVYSAVPAGFDYTGSVISYTPPAALGSTYETTCGDGSFAPLHSALDSATVSSVVQAGETFYAAALPILWDFSAIDATTPGNYTAIGNISIPAGATLASGLQSTVVVAVQVSTLVPASTTLVRFDEPDRADAVAFPVGATKEELSSWFACSVAGFTGYDAAGNAYDFISGAWSLGAVNTAQPGVYYATASPDLGTEYTLQEGLSLPSQLCTVSIQAPGQPDINCCVAGRGFVHFPWVLSAAQESQLDAFTLLLQQGGGDWALIDDGVLFVADGLQLSQKILTYGSTYGLKVTYPGGETDILTFRYTDVLSILDYSGGDRDGGDVSGEEEQTGSQTTPAATPQPTATPIVGSTPGADSTAPVAHPDTVSTPQASAPVQGPALQQSQTPLAGKPSAPAAADQISAGGKLSQQGTAAAQPLIPTTETYSPAKTVISGLRLKDLCSEGETVVFGSGDLTVSIPSALLLSLHLKDTDTLTVALTCPKSGQIVLNVVACGNQVTQLNGTTLRLRYLPQGDPTALLVQNQSDEQIDDVTYDGEFLRFAVDAAGTYTITEQPGTRQRQKGVSPLLPVSGGLLLVAGGSTLFKRRRRGE